MNKKPIILYVIDSLLMGGTEVSTIDIASELTYFKPIICHIYKNDTLKPLAEKKGIEVISLNISGTYNFNKAYISLLAAVEKVEPVLIVSSLLKSDILCRFVAKKIGIPLIGTFVNDNYSHNRLKNLSRFENLKFIPFKLLNELTIKRCNLIISNSSAIKESNCKILNYPEEKVIVVPRGRSSQEYSFEKKFNSDKTVFLNVNRLIATKRVDLLINAFAEHLVIYPDDELIIAGDGKEQERLQTLINDLKLNGKIKILGKVNNVQYLMQTSDCLVFPSNIEGFSGVLVEALMSGLPVLASDISMNKEAISHLENGYLFAVNNSKAIVDALSWFKENKNIAIRMALEFREWAHQIYDISNIANRHEKIYKEVLGI